VRRAAALAFLAVLGAAGGAQARDSDPVAVGRYHLRKANQLAGEDHCHSAIHEYTLAYEKLRDPFVLFNRAECYRRIGQGEKAISDYRAFLEAVPAAPNRADIEAKVAALTQPAPPAAPPAEPPAAAPPVPRPPPPAFTEPPHQPVVVLPPVEIQPPAAEPSAPAKPAPVLSDTAPAVAASETESPSGHSGHLWLWLAIGAVVVGGAAGAYVALRAPATTPPPTDLGNYKF
jgi:tetratricopeptide (TPR) repeat protein